MFLYMALNTVLGVLTIENNTRSSDNGLLNNWSGLASKIYLDVGILSIQNL